jgi:streptogramin lyase
MHTESIRQIPAATRTCRGSLTLATAAVASCATILLSGCAFSGSVATPITSGTTAAATHITGVVHGGQNPVVGATMQLYTVGTGGLMSTSTGLIASPPVTGAGGSFNITGLYNGCNGATPGTLVYLVATGGNPGGGNNPNLSLAAALGSCATLYANAATTSITVNEVTTVAAAYALAPFAVDYQHIGATGSNPSGLVNAFSNATVLASNTYGHAGGDNLATGLTVPTAEINTLANILATCINSQGGTAGDGSSCGTIFAATGATDTFDAAIAIAQAPGSSAITALYSLSSASSPFQPTLSNTSAPNDFTIAVRYSGSELAGPYGVALDAGGNAWVTNEAGNSVVKVPSLVPALATTKYAVGGLLAPRGVSIDRSGNVWIANTGGNDVVELSSTGSLKSGAGYSSGGVAAPVAVANDSAGNAWVANFNGNSITELGPSGGPVGASPFTGAGALSAPTAVALDAAGNLAVANAGTGQVCLFSNAAVLQQCLSDGRLLGATSVAVSSGGNISVAGSTTGAAVVGAFTLATNAGAVNAVSPVSGGGLSLPAAVAYDGSGTAWFANSTSISAFSGTSAVSGNAGFGVLSSPAGIAVDASGSVWTANSGDNSVSVFVGLATPVVTPLAANAGP